jgi:hypothetical protein
MYVGVRGNSLALFSPHSVKEGKLRYEQNQFYKCTLISKSMH